MYILVRVIALCVFGVQARGGVRSETSLWSLADNSKAKACARLTAKWKFSMAF